MERFFQILAVILAGVAAYFLWDGNADGAFISAVFGAVSFFMSVRFQVKARNDEREAERLEEERRREEEYDDEDEEFEDEALAEPETPRLNEMPARARLDDERRTKNEERQV